MKLNELSTINATSERNGEEMLLGCSAQQHKVPANHIRVSSFSQFDLSSIFLRLLSRIRRIKGCLAQFRVF